MHKEHSRLVIGILNTTPDSFHDGGLYQSISTAIEHGKKLISEGADVLDIGGESSRPGAERISIEEECQRVIEVTKQLSPLIRISIDTTKPEVAIAAKEAGASILNDVQGLTNPRMMELSADFEEVVIMHSRGTPQTMSKLTQYNALIEDIHCFFERQLELCCCPKIWLDPGIGFAKTAAQSLLLLKNTAAFLDLGHPIYIGASRKSFIGHTLSLPKTKDRLYGSLAAVAAAFHGGAKAFRVHDVLATRQMLNLLCAIEQS